MITLEGEKKGVVLKCRHCEHIFEYMGKGIYSTICQRCRKNVPLRTSKWQ